MPTPALRRSLLAAVLLAPLAACAWSVPADPGRNAALHTPPEAPGGRGGAVAPAAPGAPAAIHADPSAGALYASRCGQCHEPFAPQTFSAGEWPVYVDRYGPRAGLFGADRERVLRWLQANAR